MEVSKEINNDDPEKGMIARLRDSNGVSVPMVQRPELSTAT